jgi:hypothetical protein
LDLVQRHHTCRVCTGVFVPFRTIESSSSNASAIHVGSSDFSIEFSELPAAIAVFPALTECSERCLFLDVDNALNRYEGDAQEGSNDPGVRGEPAIEDSNGNGSPFRLALPSSSVTRSFPEKLSSSFFVASLPESNDPACPLEVIFIRQ